MGRRKVRLWQCPCCWASEKRERGEREVAVANAVTKELGGEVPSLAPVVPRCNNCRLDCKAVRTYRSMRWCRHVKAAFPIRYAEWKRNKEIRSKAKRKAAAKANYEKLKAKKGTLEWKLQHAEDMVRKGETRVRRANTILSSWKAKVKQLTKQLDRKKLKEKMQEVIKHG